MNPLINIPVQFERRGPMECHIPSSPICQQYAAVERAASRSWGTSVTVRCESYHNEEFEAKCPFCSALIKFHRRLLGQEGVDGTLGACPHARKIVEIPRPCVLQWGVVLVEFSREHAVANALRSPTVEALREAISRFSEEDITELEKGAELREKHLETHDWPLRGYVQDIAAEWRKDHNYPKEGLA